MHRHQLVSLSHHPSTRPPGFLTLSTLSTSCRSVALWSLVRGSARPLRLTSTARESPTLATYSAPLPSATTTVAVHPASGPMYWSASSRKYLGAGRRHPGRHVPHQHASVCIALIAQSLPGLQARPARPKWRDTGRRCPSHRLTPLAFKGHLYNTLAAAVTHGASATVTSSVGSRPAWKRPPPTCRTRCCSAACPQPPPCCRPLRCPAGTSPAPAPASAARCWPGGTARGGRRGQPCGRPVLGRAAAAVSAAHWWGGRAAGGPAPLPVCCVCVCGWGHSGSQGSGQIRRRRGRWQALLRCSWCQPAQSCLAGRAMLC